MLTSRQGRPGPPRKCTPSQPPFERGVLYLYVRTGIEEKGIVCGIAEGHLVQVHTLAVKQQDCMWAAHVFFALGIEGPVAVNGT